MEKYSIRTNFLWLFIYILFLHAVATLFFTRGFLLTRTELSVFSQCSDVAESLCSRSGSNYTESHANSEQDSVCEREEDQNTQVCWTKPAVDRVVLIFLDAIRFDFVAPGSFFKEVKPWMNKLQVLQKLASDEGSSARIFKAIADPPTTSLQRLKGLTTGGLPTFIDVGNSFGAPAITEDNIIYQLIKNGRRVIMMGDDTWLQLFPNHFQEAYPFPSFNVKDLHTVDDGVIEHLFPALYRNDWDILVAHFLGVDHAGHIFGVDSAPMIEKLEQYNRVLEEVVSILKNHSGPGGLHENTLLIVMGDHGQTLNGDHGGGTPEEVETSIFAMSMRSPPGLIPLTLNTSVCKSAVDGKNDICIGSIPQLDFAVTLAALVGIPFPFGSVGRVNPDLYSLSAGTWRRSSIIPDDNFIDCLNLQRWMEQYADVLCINCWQVKRYIDSYSASSVIGFSPEDLLQLADIYARTQDRFSSVIEQQSSSNDTTCKTKISALQNQIDAYSNYLEAAAELARSKWTKFGGKMMISGLALLLVSLTVHLTAFLRVGKIIVSFSKERYKISKACFPWGHLLAAGFCSTLFGIFCFPFAFSILEGVAFPQAVTALKDQVFLLVLGTFSFGSAIGYLVPFKANTYRGWKQYCSVTQMKLGHFWNYKGNLLRCMAAASIVMIRAFSFLSNSYILAEGKVANFLLASTGVLSLKLAIQNQAMILEALIFLVLNSVVGIVGQNGVSKEATTLTASNIYSSAMFQSSYGQFIMTNLAAVLPVLILILLAFQWVRVNRFSWDTNHWCAFHIGALLSYLLILSHWILDDISLLPGLSVPNVLKDTARVQFPRLVYFLTAGLASLLFYERKSKWEGGISNFKENIAVAAATMLSIWSSTILLLLGKQGPFIALLAVLQGWCLLKSQNVGKQKREANARTNELEFDPLLVIQWSLLAVQLFFCTGHRCTFDGLRYGAAFVGFDNFNIIRQGVLLAIDTFGVSHILPIFALPLLVTTQRSHFQNDKHRELLFLQAMQVFLIYGLASALAATLTAVCVTIQRRHLMVWGLFAPKYVFDILGLLLTDSLIVLTFIYYF